MIGKTVRKVSSQVPTNKKEFVLDCCNSRSSHLKPYQSEKDIYLENYFLIKKYREHTRSKKKLPKQLKDKMLKEHLIVSSAPKLHQSTTARSLPPIDSRKAVIQPLSREGFQELIKKFRTNL
jgi:hypothetical protein